MVALIVVIVALMTYVLFSFALFSDAPLAAEIYVEGKLYARYRFGDIIDEKIVEIKTEYGENTVRITKRGAEMISASCPDKKDVKVGEITKLGQVIICVPNRVSVKLVGNGKAVVDKVTY